MPPVGATRELNAAIAAAVSLPGKIENWLFAGVGPQLDRISVRAALAFDPDFGIDVERSAAQENGIAGCDRGDSCRNRGKWAVDRTVVGIIAAGRSDVVNRRLRKS